MSKPPYMPYKTMSAEELTTYCFKKYVSRGTCIHSAMLLELYKRKGVEITFSDGTPLTENEKRMMQRGCFVKPYSFNVTQLKIRGV